MVVLSDGWAGTYDVWRSGGQCGWEGACSDAGELGVLFYGLIVLLVADVALGMTAGYRAYRRKTRTGEFGAAVEALWGAEERVWATRFSVTVMLIGAAMFVVLLQCFAVGLVADRLYGASITNQAASAGFYFIWSIGLPAGELALGILAWLATIPWRRRHAEERSARQRLATLR
jgi:hypothetical protein